MMAKVKANTAAKLAAVAMVMPKSSATCGNTGSSARADRLAAKVASVMMFSAGGRRLDAVTAIPAPSPRVLAKILGQRVEPHQGPYQSFEFAQRYHVGSVRRRSIGIGMGFDEHAGHANRDRRPRQHRHEFTLAAR